MPRSVLHVQILRECTPAEAAQVLLLLLKCANADAAPAAAALAALASGMFGLLAGWAVQVAWCPTNLLVRLHGRIFDPIS